MTVHSNFPGHQLETVLREFAFRDLAFSFEEQRRILFCDYTHEHGPNVTSRLVSEFNSAYRAIKKAVKSAEPLSIGPKFYVMRSAKDDIFSFGGDLEMFVDCISRNDRATLSHYARECIVACHDTYRNLGLPFISISVISGDALGGGLECAMACDFVIAERSAILGLPEILFGMFPGMGAYSFLSRKIGPRATEDLILGGQVHSGEEMYEMGIVDVLAEDGQAAEALDKFVDKIDRKYATYSAVIDARRRVNPIEIDEMNHIVDRWVASAFMVSDKDLRKMARLSLMQKKRLAAA